tara:strand:+ start:258 stop:575 length:318 start_codon:yes stop_codon:yes gene_type:complete
MRAYASRHQTDGQVADKTIKYCKSCNQCYELKHIRRRINSIPTLIKGYFYYKGFPTLGKEKKECARCKGNPMQLLDYKGFVFHHIVKDINNLPINKYYGENRDEK